MVPPKPFPILRLPFLAIEEVFKSLHPIEIINFSMISKRAKAVTKQMTFHSKYDICLRIEEGLGIAIRVENKLAECTYLMTSDKRMDGKIEKIERDRYCSLRVYKYSKDPIEKWKLWSKHILEIFKMETVNLLSMTLDDFVDHNVSIIDFLKTNVKSVTECNLFQEEEENDVDEHAAYFLDNLKISNELYFYLNIKNDNFDGKFPKNLKQLHILNSEWVGYERLLEIDCEYVSLRDNQITNEEWNMFLKKWMAMETHLNLGFMNLGFKEIEEFRALVLHDIPHEVVDEGIERNLITFPDETDEISGGIDIRRIDGKTATFYKDFNVLSMSVN